MTASGPATQESQAVGAHWPANFRGTHLLLCKSHAHLPLKLPASHFGDETPEPTIASL